MAARCTRKRKTSAKSRPPKTRQSARRRPRQAQPAPPCEEELWPQPFAGVSAKRAERIAFAAGCAVGAALLKQTRAPRKDEVALHPLAALIAADAEVTRLIGRPVAPLPGARLPSPIVQAHEGRHEGRKGAAALKEKPSKLWPDMEAPSWIAVEEGGIYAAVVRIGFRGALVSGLSAPDDGPAMTAKAVRGKGALYTLGVAEKKGWKRRQWRARAGVETDRLYAPEALAEAVDAARAALKRAGCVLAPHFETAQMPGFQSAVAAIWVRALSPALRRAPSMGR